RQIKRWHDHGIGTRKRHPQPAAAEDEPGLVAVPERRDRVHQGVAVAFAAREGEENADAEIETVEDDIEADGGGDEQRPDDREVALAVRRMPVASQGCRPTSATIQPETIATKPKGHVHEASRRNSRESSSRPRAHWMAPQKAMKIMRSPSPTIRRKAKKGKNTG